MTASTRMLLDSLSLREKSLWAAIALCLGTRFIAHLYSHAYRAAAYQDAPDIWQLLDGDVLKAEPWASLYFMHMQPPLYNALYAVSLALPGNAGPALLQILSIVGTLAMMAVIFAFMQRFGYQAAAAGVAVAVFALLPQVWAYEHAFFYAQFEAVLLACAMLAASGYLRNRGTGLYCWFALSLLALGLTRSLFHIGWIVVALVVVAAMKSRRHGPDKAAWLVAALAIAVLGSAYFKNFVQFGKFAVSSWGPISVAQMTIPLESDRARFPEIVDDFLRRKNAGEFSRASALRKISDDTWYGWLEFAQDCGKDSQMPRVLCATRKANGKPNMNHAEILGYSEDLGRDALRSLRLYPALYADRVLDSVIEFLSRPCWDCYLARASLGRYANIWNAVFMYEPVDLEPGKPSTAPWWSLARYPTSSLPTFVLVLAAIFIVVTKAGIEFRRYWSGHSSDADWVFPGIAVILFLLVPHLINGVETNRMRYSIEPILFLALAYGGLAGFRVIRDRLEGAAPERKRLPLG